MEQTAVIIVAGGSGTRMGASVPKQFIEIGGKEILVWTIERFIEALDNPEIVVVLPAAETERWGEIAARHGLIGRHKVCSGGRNRYASVKKGLELLKDSNCAYIAVHDGVRPLLSTKMIKRCVAAAHRFGTAIPVTEPVDSFRMMNGDRAEIVNRALLRAVQTPQIFKASLLRNAYDGDYSPAFTDDASVVERYGAGLSFCEGEYRNIKITTHDDLLFAEALLKSGEL